MNNVVGCFMRDVTEKMITRFKLCELGYDFMGYNIDRKESLTFHHLILPYKECEGQKHNNEGYEEWNGAILVRSTSHDYLHLIQKYDYNKYVEITHQLIAQNLKGYLDPHNIITIDMILREFEQEYDGAITYKKNPITGKGEKEMLIKDEYTKRLSRVRLL